jgi:hypothetical protein
LQDLVSSHFTGEEVAMCINTMIDVIMEKKNAAFKSLNQIEQFIKLRCSPSFQPLAQSVVEQPQKQPVVQEVLQQSSESSNKNDWKKSDNIEFRLSSLIKMLDVLAKIETSINKESTSRSEYGERLRELENGCRIIFEHQDEQYS